MLKIEKELLPPSFAVRAPDAIERIVGVEPQRRPNEADLIIASSDQDGRNTYIELITTDFRGAVGQRTRLCTLPGLVDVVHCSCNTDRDVLCYTERVPRRDASTRSFHVVDAREAEDAAAGARAGSPTASQSAPLATSASPPRESSPLPQLPREGSMEVVSAIAAAGSAAPSAPQLTSAPPVGTAIVAPAGPSARSGALRMSGTSRSYDGSEDAITISSSVPLGDAGDVLREPAGLFEPPLGSPGARASAGAALPPSASIPDGGGSGFYSPIQQGEEYDFKLHVMFAKFSLQREVTYVGLDPKKPRPHGTRYTAGYFIAKPAVSRDKASYFIRAMDQCQIDILSVTKEGKHPERIDVSQYIAQVSLWHHWNPFTQQLAFIVQNRGTYCLRLTDFREGPANRQAAFQMTTNKFRRVIFTRPLAQPFAAAHSTSNAAINITILKTSYECGELEDFALCHQYIGSITSPSRIKKVIFTVTMLRTLKYLDVVIDVSEIATPSDYRVNFLYMHGMIAVVLAGGFIHYVDVSHRQRGPYSLFTVHLPHDFPAANFSVLPTPVNAEWVFIPDTLRVVKVELSRYRLWTCIAKMLFEGGDNTAIKHAIHVATTHFPKAIRGSDETPSNIQRLLKYNFRFLTHSVISGVLLGEAYDATRAVLSAQGNGYWSCIPIEDGRRDVAEEEAPTIDFTTATGGKVTVEQQLLLRIESREKFFPASETQNTLQDWFITAATERSRRGSSFFKSIFNSKAPPASMERFTFAPLTFFSAGVGCNPGLSPARPLSSSGPSVVGAHAGASSPDQLFRSHVAKQLRDVGVPRDDASRVAECYVFSLSNTVKQLLAVVIDSSKVFAAPQFHVLLNLCVALDVLGVPAPTALVEILSQKATSLLPHPLFLEGMKSGMFGLSVEECVSGFNITKLAAAKESVKVAAAAAAASAAEELNERSSLRGSTRFSLRGSRPRSPPPVHRGHSISLAHFTVDGDESLASRTHTFMSSTSCHGVPPWGAAPVMTPANLELLFTTNVLSASSDAHERKVDAVAVFDAPAVLQTYRQQLPAEWPLCHYPPLKMWARKCEEEERARREKLRRARPNSYLPSFIGGAATNAAEETARAAVEAQRRIRAAECLAHLYHPFNSTYANKASGAVQSSGGGSSGALSA